MMGAGRVIVRPDGSLLRVGVDKPRIYWNPEAHWCWSWEPGKGREGDLMSRAFHRQALDEWLTLWALRQRGFSCSEWVY